jgi:hypothetical protein
MREEIVAELQRIAAERRALVAKIDAANKTDAEAAQVANAELARLAGKFRNAGFRTKTTTRADIRAGRARFRALARLRRRSLASIEARAALIAALDEQTAALLEQLATITTTTGADAPMELQ